MHSRAKAKHQIIRIALVLLGLGLLGLVDQRLAAGYQLGPLYAFLIFASAYWGGRGEGILVAIVASAIWIVGVTNIDLPVFGVVPVLFNATGRILMNVFVAVVVGGFREQQSLVRRTAFVDWLTSLANSRAFHDQLPLDIREARGGGAALALLSVDCDGSDAVGEMYGQGTCEALAVCVGNVLKASVRPGDFVARVGEGRFAVLAREADEQTAGRLAEAIRVRCAASTVRAPEGTPLPVSVSVGVACYVSRPHSDPVLDGEDLRRRAANAARTVARRGGDGVAVG